LRRICRTTWSWPGEPGGTLYDRTMGPRQSFGSTALERPSGGAWLMWYASPGGGFLLGDLTVT